MTQARVVAIAEAVVDALNAADLSQSFTAERNYLPARELPDHKTLRVTVCHSPAMTMRAESRRADRFHYMIDVGVQKRFTTETARLSEGDALTLLVEEIVDLFRSQPLSAVTGVQCVAAENPSGYGYVPDDVHNLNQYTSVVRLTFTTLRTR